MVDTQCTFVLGVCCEDLCHPGRFVHCEQYFFTVARNNISAITNLVVDADDDGIINNSVDFRLVSVIVRHGSVGWWKAWKSNT
jgi:hypothetical protein